MFTNNLSLIIVLLLNSIIREGKTQNNRNLLLENDKPNSRPVPNYRVVNWCITGKDEPELHMFPHNQFIPILKRAYRFTPEDKNQTVKYDLRFYEIQTTQKDVGRKGALLKTVHVVFKAERLQEGTFEVREKWLPLPLEGLIIQANHNPGTIGLPTGQFFPPENNEIVCLDCHPDTFSRSIPCRKRPNFAIEHPTVLLFHHLMNPKNASNPLLSTDTTVIGRQPEIHANFRWYSPPCTETRRLQFTILAVRSFQNHKYDILKKGPYEVIVRDQNYQSDNFPSPYFTDFTLESLCHKRSSSDIQTEKPKKFFEFEMSSKFGCCTRYEENPKADETLKQITEKYSIGCEKITRSVPVPLTIEKSKESYICYYPPPIKPCEPREHERADLNYKQCDPCPQPPSTTAEIIKSTPYSIFKRTFHGEIMIMTNFCLQPIVIYIARFYKETFNLHSYKGVKLWYWLHLVGGMLSSIMIYFGYFSGHATREQGFSHRVIGDAYILTLLFCYLTSWGRHKNHLVNLIAEFLHGSLGYITISLALACVVTAPDLLFTSKLLVYLMLGVQGVFMVIMTGHICMLDHKVGMRPRRRHFPTVEARFDEVPVPKGKLRITLLIIFSSITFCLSFSSTFFD